MNTPPPEQAASGLCVAEHARVGVRRDPVLFDPGPPLGAPRINDPERLAELVVAPLDGLDREHCVVVAMNVKHQVVAMSTVSIGTHCHTFMEPREIYRDTLLQGGVALAVAHNHPSGDPQPSPEDRAVTRRLARVGEMLGVPLLDHLIVGSHGRWRSLGRMGLIPGGRRTEGR